MFKDLPKTRKEAKEMGSKYYFTGEKCSNGHIDKRYTYNHTCCSCAKLSRKNSDNHYKNKKHRKTMERLLHPNQMPSWADKETIGDMVIVARDRGMVLDHIVPLKGKKRGGIQVCGLHSQDNLQEMSYDDNDMKSFNEWPDMWETIGEFISKPIYRLSDREKMQREVDRLDGKIFGIKFHKGKSIYEVYFKNRYIGSSKDIFNCYCLRKSTEARYAIDNNLII